MNSRYYNPEWGRFINADNYISTDTGILGYNMYTYTNNNPIGCHDSSGKVLFGLFFPFAAVVLAVVSVVSNIIENKAKNKAKGEINQVQKKNSKKPKTVNTKFRTTLKKML